MIKNILEIEGMMCGMCEANIQSKVRYDASEGVCRAGACFFEEDRAKKSDGNSQHS